MQTVQIKNIPSEIFAVACGYEGIEVWEGREREGYEEQTKRRATTGGFERALSDYLLRQGDFADAGRYADIDGYEL